MNISFNFIISKANYGSFSSTNCNVRNIIRLQKKINTITHITHVQDNKNLPIQVVGIGLYANCGHWTRKRLFLKVELVYNWWQSGYFGVLPGHSCFIGSLFSLNIFTFTSEMICSCSSSSLNTNTVSSIQSLKWLNVAMFDSSWTM